MSHKKRITRKESPHVLYATSRGQLGWLFGVTEHAVKAWLAKGMPAKTERGYDVRDIIAWRFGQSEDVEERASARRRLEVAKADLAELDRDSRRGQLVNRNDVKKQNIKRMRAFVTMLDSVGSEMAGKIAGKRMAEVKKLLDAYAVQCRERLLRL